MRICIEIERKKKNDNIVVHCPFESSIWNFAIVYNTFTRHLVSASAVGW